MSTQKRQSFKTSILRIANYSNSAESLAANKSVLQSYLQTLQGYWENYLKHHADVEAVTGPSELPFQQSEMVDTEKAFIETKAKLLTKLDMAEPNSSPSGSSVMHNSPTNISLTTRAEIPLPPMNIPTFSGKSTEWMEFIALFKAHIDNKPRLSKVQKFQYLKSKLDGEAAQLLRNYSLTDANYTIALDALTARYENKRVIANAHLKMLFSQASVKVESSATLRKLVDNTNDCVRALNALEIDTASWDPVLVFLITQKLDPSTILEWERTLKTSELPKLKDITIFLESRCRAIEAVTNARSILTSKEPKSGNTVALQATATPLSCVVCNESHLIRTCPTFLAMTIDARTNTIRENRLCFNCFNPHHSSRICRAAKCRNCSRKHNILLHSSNSSG